LLCQWLQLSGLCLLLEVTVASFAWWYWISTASCATSNPTPSSNVVCTDPMRKPMGKCKEKNRNPKWCYRYLLYHVEFVFKSKHVILKIQMYIRAKYFNNYLPSGCLSRILTFYHNLPQFLLVNGSPLF
jgi:hypothetical protein